MEVYNEFIHPKVFSLRMNCPTYAICHIKLSFALVVTFVCLALIFRLHCVAFVCTGVVQTKIIMPIL